MIQNIKKYIYVSIYVKEKLPVAVTLLKKNTS